MTKVAKVKQDEDRASIDGLEEFFMPDSDRQVSENNEVIDGQVTVIERLSAQEAQSKLNISERTLRRWIAKGRLKTDEDELGRRIILVPVRARHTRTASDSPEETDKTGGDRAGQQPVTVTERDCWVSMLHERDARIFELTREVGRLEGQLEVHVKLLTDSQRKGSWWDRVASWALGR